MSGATIAAQVAAALHQAGRATGDGTSHLGAILRTVRTGGTDPDPILTPERTPCPVLLGPFTAREREGTSISLTDLKATVPAVGFDITPADHLEAGGVTYEIVDVMPTKPGGIVVMWRLVVRA